VRNLKKSFHLKLVAGALLAARAVSAQLTIQFLDVGQGDAALIRTAGNKTVLIDAGPAPRTVAQWLRRAHVDTIDLVIASHNHADHIGGMPAVLSTVHVRNYMDNGMPATTGTYARIVTMLEEKGTSVLKASPRRIDLGDGVTVRILGSMPKPRTQNDASIGVEVSYGKFVALFTGDAEGRQRAFWATDSLRPIDVLKVAHHGSINGTDAAFLRALHPCIAIVSVGAKNSFRHPSSTVMRLLQASGVMVYRTDRLGSVTILADSTGLAGVHAERTTKSSRPGPASCSMAPDR
jgi:competence protein ComEC